LLFSNKNKNAVGVPIGIGIIGALRLLKPQVPPRRKFVIGYIGKIKVFFTKELFLPP
jgi:hypothetical protein